MTSPLTGLGYLDMKVLRCVERLSEPKGFWVRALDVLRLVDDVTGIAPEIAYECLLDLGRPWIHHLPLLEFQGVVGSQDGDPAAAAEFVRTNLSPLGRLVLATEDRGVAFPFDLLIGNFHRRGLQPSFRPDRVVTAMQWLLSGGRGQQDFVQLLGLPSYPTGSRASVDLRALANGERCELTLYGRVSEEPDGAIRIDSLPPHSGPSEVLQMLRNMRDTGDSRQPEYDNSLVSGLALDRAEAGLDSLILRYETPREDWALFQRALHNLHYFYYIDAIQLPSRLLLLAQQGIGPDDRISVDAITNQIEARWTSND